MNDDPGLPDRLWSAVGLFAAAEAQIDDVIKLYTRTIPAELRKQVLRPIRNHERAQALKAILSDKGLSAGYPGLVDLFVSVKRTRDLVVHSGVTTEDGEVTLTRYEQRRQVTLSPEDVTSFHGDSGRLHDTLQTLLVELGLIGDVTVISTGGRRTLTGADLLANVADDEPRPGFWVLIDRVLTKHT